MKTLLLPSKFPIYAFSRAVGRAFILPISYTYSITSRCDSRCITCGIWKNKADDLTKYEWKKIIRNIGKSPYWITLTGGNQFLRKDMEEIVGYILKYNSPKIINIPVSATMPDLVVKKTKSILSKNKSTRFMMNISLDGIGDVHDRVRGVKGGFTSTVKTIKRLKEIQREHRNLSIGVYTIISRFNIKDFKKIEKLVKYEIKPDQWGYEVAEPRKELHNLNQNFFPKGKELLNILENTEHYSPKKGISYLRETVRKRYYRILKKTIQKKSEQVRCYAGIASIQISNDGEVWQCCTKADSFGNLREENYDFRRIFFGKKGDEIRRKIKEQSCYCTHSNPYYTNILSDMFNPK